MLSIKTEFFYLVYVVILLFLYASSGIGGENTGLDVYLCFEYRMRTGESLDDELPRLGLHSSDASRD